MEIVFSACFLIIQKYFSFLPLTGNTSLCPCKRRFKEEIVTITRGFLNCHNYKKFFKLSQSKENFKTQSIPEPDTADLYRSKRDIYQQVSNLNSFLFFWLKIKQFCPEIPGMIGCLNRNSFFKLFAKKT